jgi:hypothetical protein
MSNADDLLQQCGTNHFRNHFGVSGNFRGLLRLVEEMKRAWYVLGAL